MNRDNIQITMDRLSELLDYTAPAAPAGQTVPEEQPAGPAPSPEEDLDRCDRVPGGTNVLLYGVPGCGKSWIIQQEYCGDEDRMERLVFHPDYTYSDFVGQILPDVTPEGQVRYSFSPGPFPRLLRKAYRDPQREYFLIIEELNRGSAPAIFGEVFQLLDRKTAQGADGFPAGTSEYAITNGAVASFVYGDAKHKVRIPSNLTILGTMNTSDQNAFPLDTAFQRRWELRLVENSFEGHPYAASRLLDTGVTWQAFCQAVNREIVDRGLRMNSAEDKQLGAYFVAGAYLHFDPAEDDPGADAQKRAAARRSNRRFPEKVLKYLWDDAFRFSRESAFDLERCTSLEALLRAFTTARGNRRLDVFQEDLRRAMLAAARDAAAPGQGR